MNEAVCSSAKKIASEECNLTLARWKLFRFGEEQKDENVHLPLIF